MVENIPMTGLQAFLKGAAAGGCRFLSAGGFFRSEWAREQAQRLDMVFVQARSAAAALGMAVGAGHAGVRAMVAGCGNRFPEMSAGVAHAGMVETPVVIFMAGQPDLFQVLGAGGGECSEIILSPFSFEDCFHAGVEAFNLAEVYQCPVVVMSDVFDQSGGGDVEVPDMERGIWARPVRREPSVPGNEFDRYAYVETDSGVSPRAVPGQENLMFIAYPDRSARMIQKRMRKLSRALERIGSPVLEGPLDAELTVVCWGSSCHVARKVMVDFNGEGASTINVLPLRVMWPFPGESVGRILSSARRVMVMENSRLDQIARLVRRESGFFIHHRCLKCDDEPLSPGRAAAEVDKVLGL